jgi:voltage-gated potassium channel
MGSTATLGVYNRREPTPAGASVASGILRRPMLHAAFHQPGTRVYRTVQGTVWGLIVLSIGLLAVEAALPDGSPAAPLLGAVDRIVLVVFAIEILLRVGSYRPPSLQVFARPPMGRVPAHLLARLGYALKPLQLIDILAVLALVPGLRGLRALRLLRLLRTNRVFRYRNPFAIVLRSLEENGLLFLFAFAILGVATLLGGVSFYLVEARSNPEIESVLDGVWWSLVTITTVGFGDIAPVTGLGRVIGAVLMMGGMFTLALFAGIVGSSLVSGMLSIREEQFRMSDYVNHVVVCGYDESTHLLLDALAREIELDETSVVLFDDDERPRDLPPAFHWVQGDPTKESELDKVRVTHAAAVVVSGSRETTPQAADARTILTLFTLRSFMRRDPERLARRRRSLYLVAEILDAENVDHARTAGADEVIETRRIGYSMIAHAIGFHGTATTMSRVLLTGAHNVYIGQVPGAPDTPIQFGEFLDLAGLPDRGGLAIGIHTPTGDEVINPPRDRAVDPGTMLIYLAETALLEPPG